MKCGKRCFPTRGSALRFLLKRDEKYPSSLILPMWSYNCGKCKAWHLTRNRSDYRSFRKELPSKEGTMIQKTCKVGILNE